MAGVHTNRTTCRLHRKITLATNRSPLSKAFGRLWVSPRCCEFLDQLTSWLEFLALCTSHTSNICKSAICPFMERIKRNRFRDMANGWRQWALPCILLHLVQRFAHNESPHTVTYEYNISAIPTKVIIQVLSEQTTQMVHAFIICAV